MRDVGRKSRKILSLSGPFHYTRQVFECRDCRASFAPLDEEFGVSPGLRLTPSVTRRVAWLGARASFEQASRDLQELLNLSVSRAEFARVAHEEGTRMDRVQRQREERLLDPVSPQQPAPPAERQCDRLILTADATSVLTVAGEENKMVYCGRAFDASDRGRKEGSNRPFLASSKLTASAEGLEDFGPRLKALGHQMGMRSARAIAFVADGARCLWSWAEQSLPPGTVMIQDIWHVLEHLSALAKDLYGEPWKQTFERWKRMLKDSQVDSIIAELEHERGRRGHRLRRRIAEELTYLRAGRDRMDYARYRREGWPIGSGAIEGTCKHLVKERFNITGARWRRDSIRDVLALRLSMFNEQWAKDWALAQAAYSACQK